MEATTFESVEALRNFFRSGCPVPERKPAKVEPVDPSLLEAMREVTSEEVVQAERSAGLKVPWYMPTTKDWDRVESLSKKKNMITATRAHLEA